MIRLDSIGKRHGKQILFVEASCAINRGEKIGLVGPNGSGKTTLFRMITGREEPDEGQVSTERGTTIGYQDLIVDYRGLPAMQSFGAPVVLDCTHSLQQPNQSSGVTGGRPALIETISRGITLYPGDVIATGTPAGVGMGMQPPRWLRSGDMVRIEVDGIGAIENSFI